MSLKNIITNWKYFSLKPINLGRKHRQRAGYEPSTIVDASWCFADTVFTAAL